MNVYLETENSLSWSTEYILKKPGNRGLSKQISWPEERAFNDLLKPRNKDISFVVNIY